MNIDYFINQLKGKFNVYSYFIKEYNKKIEELKEEKRELLKQLDLIDEKIYKYESNIAFENHVLNKELKRINEEFKGLYFFKKINGKIKLFKHENNNVIEIKEL